MECRDCKQQTCVYHRCVWHAGRTCAQYDQDARSSEEVALLQYFERHGTVREATPNQRPAEPIGAFPHENSLVDTLVPSGTGSARRSAQD